MATVETTGTAFGLRTLFSTERVKAFTAVHGEVIAERLRAIALLVAYVLQFVALVSLLKHTGGPIDSPFAQMALAIAIFTPFIMNKYWSMVLVLATTMVYYVWLVKVYGFVEFGPDNPRPSEESYVAVNLLILVLAFIMTLRYQQQREQTRDDGPSNGAAGT